MQIADNCNYPVESAFLVYLAEEGGDGALHADADAGEGSADQGVQEGVLGSALRPECLRLSSGLASAGKE